jgi:hypothetical protein
VDTRSRSSIHEREDFFSHLPVNVADDGVDIYDGLSGYFDDVVEFEGKKARMEVSLVDTPPLLQIQLQASGVTLKSAENLTLCREFNSIVIHFNPTSRKHMSNSERPSTWIAS